MAQKASIKGVILNQDEQAVSGVNIKYSNNGTQTDKNGFYYLEIPENQDVILQFTHLSFKPITITIHLKAFEVYEFNPVMLANRTQISEVIIRGNENKRIKGITTISPEVIRKIPGANAGVENLLKLLPGVSSNNELSTQYSVRGGNYDENLVYVNDIEVYRPFLIRSGQQEGLSFVNSDLTSSVNFSAGGFQAKYGDKLSSVLNITYKKPKALGISINLSLLESSAAVEGTSKNGKFTAILGLRHRDNSLLVDAKETETNFTPTFIDAQTYLTYQLSDKLELSFLGHLAINKYNYEPLTRQSNFGTLAQPLALIVNFQGQERDQYDTHFGALKATYTVSENYTASFIMSAFNTKEQEHFDIFAEYRLGEVNTTIGSENLGEVEFSKGIGSQLTHARNDLDALIINLEHKGQLKINDHILNMALNTPVKTLEIVFKNLKLLIRQVFLYVHHLLNFQTLNPTPLLPPL